MRRTSTYGPGVDEAVLAELRAIRHEIHDLSERVAAAATRDDLHNYVTAEAFQTHLAAQRAQTESWRSWAPFTLSTAAFCWSVFWTLLGQHIILR